MVLPLIAMAGARLAAGAAVRGVATRAATTAGGKAAVNSLGGRLASQAVGSYGVNALQRGHQNRQPRQDHGITQWARENPGEALVSGTIAMARGTSLADRSMGETQSVLQSSQFG